MRCMASTVRQAELKQTIQSNCTLYHRVSASFAPAIVTRAAGSRCSLCSASPSRIYARRQLEAVMGVKVSRLQHVHVLCHRVEFDGAFRVRVVYQVWSTHFYRSEVQLFSPASATSVVFFSFTYKGGAFSPSCFGASRIFFSFFFPRALGKYQRISNRAPSAPFGVSGTPVFVRTGNTSIIFETKEKSVIYKSVMIFHSIGVVVPFFFNLPLVPALFVF